jgi:hypothetical protein
MRVHNKIPSARILPDDHNHDDEKQTFILVALCFNMEDRYIRKYR